MQVLFEKNVKKFLRGVFVLFGAMRISVTGQGMVSMRKNKGKIRQSCLIFKTTML